MPQIESSPAQTIWGENAADVLFKGDELPSVEWSRQVSNLAGKPVGIFHLDEIPFRIKAPENSKSCFFILQKALRERWLRGAMHAMSEDVRLSEFHDPANIAEYQEPNNSTISGSSIAEGYFPERLSGRSVVSSVILSPDRKWTPKQEWQDMTRLGADEIERWPDNRAIKQFVFLHEFGHATQKWAPSKWARETDADTFGHEQMEARARRLEATGTESALKEATELRETSVAWKQSRTLSEFFHSGATEYWNALAFDATEPGMFTTFWRENVLAGYDLKRRVADKMTGRPALSPEDAADRREGIKGLLQLSPKEQEKQKPGYMKQYKDAETIISSRSHGESLRALQAVVQEQGADMHPHTLRAGQLALEAAERFSPSLLKEPAPGVMARISKGLGHVPGMDGVGAAMGTMGLIDAHKRGDTTGELIAGGNVTTSVISGTMKVLGATKKVAAPALEGAEGMLGKANFGLTIIDGVYQVSKEKTVAHKAQRATAVTATAGAGIVIGAALGGAVVAPMVAAAAVGYTADKAIEITRTYEDIDRSIAEIKADTTRFSTIRTAPMVLLKKELGEIGFAKDAKGNFDFRNPDNVKKLTQLIEREKKISHDTVERTNPHRYMPRWMQDGDTVGINTLARDRYARLDAASQELPDYMQKLKAQDALETKWPAAATVPNRYAALAKAHDSAADHTQTQQHHARAPALPEPGK